MKQYNGFERKEQIEWEQLPKGAYAVFSESPYRSSPARDSARRAIPENT